MVSFHTTALLLQEATGIYSMDSQESVWSLYASDAAVGSPAVVLAPPNTYTLYMYFTHACAVLVWIISAFRTRFSSENLNT